MLSDVAIVTMCEEKDSPSRFAISIHSQAPDARLAFCVRPKIAPPGRAWVDGEKKNLSQSIFFLSVAKYFCVRLFDFRARGI